VYHFYAQKTLALKDLSGEMNLAVWGGNDSFLKEKVSSGSGV
jgi:hypothetical protein